MLMVFGSCGLTPRFSFSLLIYRLAALRPKSPPPPNYCIHGVLTACRAYERSQIAGEKQKQKQNATLFLTSRVEPVVIPTTTAALKDTPVVMTGG